MNNKILISDNEYAILANYVEILQHADNLCNESIKANVFHNLIEHGFEYIGTEEVFTVCIDNQTYCCPAAELKPFYTEKEFTYLLKKDIKEDTVLELDTPESEREGEGHALETFFIPEEDIVNKEEDGIEEEENEEIEEIIRETEPAAEEGEVEFPTFSKYDISKIPTRLEEKFIEKDEVKTEIIPIPGVNMDFISNYNIEKIKCFFSTFRCVVHTKESAVKEEIFIMVYPFNIEQDCASTNIAVYAYFRGENHCATSLVNEGQNSVILRLADYEFLVRGRFDDYKFTSSIQTTGASIKNQDVLEVVSEHTVSPYYRAGDDNNGHIKFKYIGYINFESELADGLIEVFPTDFTMDSFLVIKRMEDFIDIYYTDDINEISVQTKEGIKMLNCYWEKDLLRTELI